MTSNWPEVTIGEVCQLYTGGTPSRAKPEFFENGDIAWLVSGDVNRTEIFECEGRITEAGLNSSNARFLPLNSVVIALAGQGKTRGTVALLRIEATCNQSVVAISPNSPNQLIPEYLFWNLKGRYQEIRRMSGDDERDRRGLNMAQIRSIRIPLPPLDEQKRIVAKLDQSLGDLDQVIENSTATLEQIDALWQSALVDLLDIAYLGPTTFKRERCVEVFNLIGGGTPSKANGDFWNGDIPWASIRDLKSRRLDRTEFSITEEGLKSSASNLIPAGNVVIATRVGLGKVVQLSQDTAINQDLRALVPKDPNRLMPDYIYYWYLINASKVIAAGTGATVQGVKLETIENLEIPIISIDEQKQVVYKLDNLKAHIDGLRKTKLEKIEDAKALRSSVLIAAFAGDF